MGIHDFLLLIIAIAAWLVWYELRYGIEARKERERKSRNLSRQWKAESDARWKEFSDARRDEKTWKEYLEKQAGEARKLGEE